MNPDDQPQNKHHFFILEIGREKESYAHFFYNEIEFSLHEFMIQIDFCVKKAAEYLIANNSKINKKISDFTLLFKSLDFITEFGYKSFEPNFATFEDRDLEFQMTNSIYNFKGEDELIYDYKSKNEYNIFIISLWDGIYHDAIKRRFFLFTDSLNEAFNITEGKFIQILKNINEFKKTQVDYCNNDSLEMINNIKGKYYEDIAHELIKTGLKEIYFHGLFCGCRHSLSPHIESTVGKVIYEKLVNYNEKYEERNIIETNKDSTTDRTKFNNDEDDLPF